MSARISIRPLPAPETTHPVRPQPFEDGTTTTPQPVATHEAAPIKADFGTVDARLPPIPPHRQDVFRFYRLEYRPDGLPCKRLEDGRLVPHPIYTPYVIDAYALEYSRTKDRAYQYAISQVADCAARQMETVGNGGLAWFFEPKDGLTLFPHRFYSGLVQVRYLRSLVSAAEATDRPDLLALADSVYRSLLVPVHEGGVLLETPHGPIVEEYPHAVPTFVLNGWTTVICELLRYARRTGNADAAGFAERSLAPLRTLLPLYDLPGLLNTRYQLTGFAYLKLVTRHPRTLAIRDFTTRISGQTFCMGDERQGRWYNYIRSKDLHADGFADHRQILLNGVFSLIEAEQAIDLVLEARDATEVELFLAQGDYDPMLTAMPTQRWVSLGRFDLPAGHTAVRVDAPNDAFDLVAYPTNFRKRIAGANYNAYHFIHAQNLEEIHAEHPEPIWADFAARWRGYVTRWPDSPLYTAPDLCFTSLREDSLATPYADPTI